MKSLALVFAVVLMSVAPCVGQVADFEKDRLPITQLSASWRFHPGDDAQWAGASFNDSAWSLLRPDNGWNNQGYNGYTGFGWYRLRVTLPPRPKALALFLPVVANSYQVFANGKLIGESRGMPPAPGVAVDYRRSFPIPQDVLEPDRPLVLAIRVWQQKRTDSYPSGGLLAPPVLGEAAVIERYQSLNIHQAFWAGTDTWLNLIFNLLTAAAGLSLFALRRKEREYLWFGGAQLLWAVQGMVSFGVSFLAVPFFAAVLFSGLAKACAQFLNLEFFVTLMGLRQRFLYWTAAGAALIPVVLMLLVAFGWLEKGTLSVAGTVLELVYGICVPALLFHGAARGNRDALLLIAPFTVSFSLNVIGDVLMLPGIAQRQPAIWFLGQLHRLFNWPFPISAFNIAGDLAMFSVIGVLVYRYARTRTDEERLESELEAARAVQHVLIPDEIPSVPGYSVECVYKPAGQVGGDFFQIIPLPEGDALVAIGDVSGKGMPAAMTVSMVVGIIRTLARTMQSPAGILAAMNQNMIDRTFGGFTTCLILHVGHDGVVTAANAGHIAPYLGGQEVPVQNGLPLGLMGTAVYAESAFQLSPDDQLTLLTDGVLEARTTSGELFGFDRAASMSGKSAAEIAHAAEQFGQEDDITVLSLIRQPFAKSAIGMAASPTWSAATA
jgi:Stage II sporulation protein E (SpoIIE)